MFGAPRTDVIFVILALNLHYNNSRTQKFDEGFSKVIMYSSDDRGENYSESD